MQLNLLNDKPFIRYVENLQKKLDAPEIEKELLKRLKSKLEILDELTSIIENSDKIDFWGIEHEDLCDYILPLILKDYQPKG